jgi:hypothetical protein
MEKKLSDSDHEDSSEYDSLEKTADLQLAIEHGLAQRVYEIKNEQLLYSNFIIFYQTF